jgi:hypothetical protein
LHGEYQIGRYKVALFGGLEDVDFLLCGYVPQTSAHTRDSLEERWCPGDSS